MPEQIGAVGFKLYMSNVLRLLIRIVKIIINIDGHGHKHNKKHVCFGYVVGQPKAKDKKHMPLALQITSEQKINVRLNPVTSSGKPAALDGKPEWSVVSGDSTLVVADDGMSADLVSSDTAGDTQYLVEADADLGSGVQKISDTIGLRVDTPMAESLGLVAGTAVPKA